MKLDKYELKIAGIGGMVVAFVSGMLVEHTTKIIVSAPNIIVGVLITSTITLVLLGALVFSEFS